MADNHITAVQFAQHRNGDLSGEGPLRFPMHILRAEADPGGGAQGIAGRFEGRKRRRYDHVGMGRGRHSFEEVANKAYSLRGRFIHLPVADDEWPTHGGLNNKGMEGMSSPDYSATRRLRDSIREGGQAGKLFPFK